MQNVSCPSCGAPVTFRSSASVMAVCSYCQTTLLKDADSVKDMGRMSDVLEDYSPIQIGTSGRYGKLGFTVVGRIQLRYSAGMWNEWYVLFDDGTAGWLGDSSGRFVMTREQPVATHLPSFEEIAPARSYSIDGGVYTAAEKRVAQCVGGQGELPFKVGQGWQARVADFRSGGQFVTLDFSDADEGDRAQTVMYAGRAVRLEQLGCQLLRDDETIKAAAGRFRGKTTALACPSCGHPIRYLPGLTSTLVCPGCGTQVDAAGPTAQVLAAGQRVAQVRTTLELGATANIGGVPHEIIGVMRRADEEGTQWTEYLMHSVRSGFVWLVETDTGWMRAWVQDDWPEWRQSDTALVGNRPFERRYDYTARVAFVAGAFNWRVQVGDATRVIEFANGRDTLAAEITSEEMTWSLAAPVAPDVVRAWFGAEIAADKAKPAGETDVMEVARAFLWGILIVNIIPLMIAFDQVWLPMAIAAAAIYLPAKYLSVFGGDAG